MSGGKQPVLMAVIGAPHGVRGEVRVKPFGEDPLALGDYGPLFDDKGNTYQVKAIRPSKTVVVVRFDAVNSREQAEALNGTELFIDRSRLPDDALDDDEYFQADLIGMTVRDAEAKDYGQVIAIHDFGGGDIIELRKGDARSVMIPFNGDAVTDIDMEGRIIMVSPLAAGLEDEGEPGPGSRKRRPPRRKQAEQGD
ncbi:ribosome maturation factor RimM [Hoeflea sp. WL0058]|uniref:Ribosome maturation factor RimM n=1 Tax=Flavimaribacter sediminis TaxID=2865987 RepID=A0AAE3D2F7_9HYPH|nr:ribosome maturation factor RimM [Flavimaribacter sediminis]MBW8638573.1 ribosome maturation factor RimM [Flavimaribacter sediminis]